MAKNTSNQSGDQLTSVERTAAELSAETLAEVDGMAQVGDINLAENEKPAEVQFTDAEKSLCELFGFAECSPEQKKALATAERLLQANPAVALASVMLGMTNLPD